MSISENFKSFLVEGWMGNIFKIIFNYNVALTPEIRKAFLEILPIELSRVSITSSTEGLTPDVIKTFFENLPIEFALHKLPKSGVITLDSERINEPLEVYIQGSVFEIYPPKKRIITCTTFDYRNAGNIISQMRFDNVMNLQYPGYGQARTSVYFNPSILGVANWTPGDQFNNEVLVEINAYPKE